MRLPSFLSTGGDSRRPGAVTLVWVAAVLLTGFAAAAAKDMARATSATSAPTDLPPPAPLSTMKMAVPRAELVRVAEIVRSGRPQIRVVLEGSVDSPVLSIAADRLEAWETWESAIADTLSTVPGAEWRFLQLCSGRECPQVPLSASLSVVRRIATTP